MTSQILSVRRLAWQPSRVRKLPVLALVKMPGIEARCNWISAGICPSGHQMIGGPVAVGRPGQR